MYAAPDQRFSSRSPRSRRVGYGRLAATRPPRQVPTWRRTVRNLVIGAGVLALLFALFTTHVLGAPRPQPAQVVVVQPGQTVWSIAQARYPDQDPQQMVLEIDQTNHLAGGLVYPGERLRLPAT